VADLQRPQPERGSVASGSSRGQERQPATTALLCHGEQSRQRLSKAEGPDRSKQPNHRSPENGTRRVPRSRHAPSARRPTIWRDRRFLGAWDRRPPTVLHTEVSARCSLSLGERRDARSCFIGERNPVNSGTRWLSRASGTQVAEVRAAERGGVMMLIPTPRWPSDRARRRTGVPGSYR
jgi:hypothetical protein